jgi:hypothetical protein
MFLTRAQVPEQYVKAFDSENATAKENVRRLREKIRERMPAGSVREYRATWGGVVDGKPVAGSLDDFARMVTEVRYTIWIASVCLFV